MGEDEVSGEAIGSEGSGMNHFVLIHGLGHGGWCWYKIKPLLEACGFQVTCLDLKSSGIDPTRPDSILSFTDYNHPLLRLLSSLPRSQQVILVGHSAGGLSLTEAIHKFPHKIKMAVYVAATMLRSGFCTPQDFKDCVPELDDVYEIEFGLGSEHPPTTAIIKKQLQRELLYNLSPQEDSTLASMLLRPGPCHALSSARFGEEKEGHHIDRVPRVYVKTLHDMIIKPEQQDWMIRKWPPSEVYPLESDHSPFFSTPSLLFGLLLKAAHYAPLASPLN